MPIRPNVITDTGITLRSIHTWDECLAAEDLQRAVWQMPDYRDAVPANMLITVVKNGGCLLGAFDGSRLVGLAFGFLGLDYHLDPPVLKECSHMLAVLPEYQSRKLGVQLKLEQRELALAQNIPLITWTYDPLLALNANLNIARLGTVARRYIRDAYGAMTDGLNAGLASDRFEVEWWIDTPRVQARVSGQTPRADWDALVRAGAQEVFTVSRDSNQMPRIVGTGKLEGDTLLVEIPSDLAAVKAAQPDVAREWRAQTRLVFERAFSAGYAATDFVLAVRGHAPRAGYVLARTDLPKTV